MLYLPLIFQCWRSAEEAKAESAINSNEGAPIFPERSCTPLCGTCLTPGWKTGVHWL